MYTKNCSTETNDLYMFRQYLYWIYDKPIENIFSYGNHDSDMTYFSLSAKSSSKTFVRFYRFLMKSVLYDN